MAVGIQYTKQQIDNLVGSMARQFKQLMAQAADFKAWLDLQADADLTAMGYNAEDIAVLRDAALDMASLAAVARGLATVNQAKDFTGNTKKLWGTGF